MRILVFYTALLMENLAESLQLMWFVEEETV
jgi:hypothetical protein